MTVQQIEVICEATTQQTLSVGGQVSIFVNMGTGGYYEQWLDSLPVCDSDNVSSGTGSSAQDAGVPIGGYYLTSFNHVEAPGGIPKRRLI
jgi:hypothetical protein